MGSPHKWGGRLWPRAESFVESCSCFPQDTLTVLVGRCAPPEGVYRVILVPGSEKYLIPLVVSLDSQLFGSSHRSLTSVPQRVYYLYSARLERCKAPSLRAAYIYSKDIGRVRVRVKARVRVRVRVLLSTLLVVFV